MKQHLCVHTTSFVLVESLKNVVLTFFRGHYVNFRIVIPA